MTMLSDSTTKLAVDDTGAGYIPWTIFAGAHPGDGLGAMLKDLPPGGAGFDCIGRTERGERTIGRCYNVKNMSFKNHSGSVEVVGVAAYFSMIAIVSMFSVEGGHCADIMCMGLRLKWGCLPIVE